MYIRVNAFDATRGLRSSDLNAISHHSRRPALAERDYGQEGIEILLQVMENQGDDLVAIVAGYGDRMDTIFRSNPGLSSRIAHHLDFPGDAPEELEEIAQRMLVSMQYDLRAGRMFV